VADRTGVPRLDDRHVPALRCVSYAEIRPGARGAVDQLWPLHRSRMEKHDRLENGRVRYGVQGAERAADVSTTSRRYSPCGSRPKTASSQSRRTRFSRTPSAWLRPSRLTASRTSATVPGPASYWNRDNPNSGGGCRAAA
jgi:hypothetical protein